MNKKLLYHIAFILLIIFSTTAIRLMTPNHTDLSEKQLEEIQDINGDYYLYQHDPYYYYNLANRGEITNFLTLNEVYLHKFLLIFDEDISLMYAASFIPLLYTILLCITVYFLIFMFTNEPVSAFFGAFLLSINSRFLINSYIGFTDTNTLIHFFIALTILILFWRIKTHSALKLFIRLCLFLFVTPLFKFTWEGWPVAILLITISFALYEFNKMKSGKHKLIIILGFVFMSVIFALLNYKTILSFLRLDKNNTQFLLIHEMLTPLINFLYLTLMLIFGIFLIRIYLKNKDKIVYNLLLIWFFSTAILSLIAVRHIFYFIIPLMITIAIVGDNTIKLFDKFNKSHYIKAGIMILCCITMFFSFPSASKSDFVPVMDDSIIEVSEYINNNTNIDSIILSSWDNGHIYKTYIDREILYSLGTPPHDNNFFTALLTDDEQDSYNLMHGLAKNRSFILIINSNMIKKSQTMENITGLDFTADSIMFRGIRDGHDFTYLEQRYCSETSFKKICVYTEKVMK